MKLVAFEELGSYLITSDLVPFNLHWKINKVKLFIHKFPIK
jgi:hypothetical protein